MATLIVSWTDNVPLPINGYRIFYRRQGVSTDPFNVVIPNPTSSPCDITVSPGSYEGTVEASCGGGNYGPPVSWVSTTPLL